MEPEFTGMVSVNSTAVSTMGFLELPSVRSLLGRHDNTDSKPLNLVPLGIILIGLLNTEMVYLEL